MNNFDTSKGALDPLDSFENEAPPPPRRPRPTPAPPAQVRRPEYRPYDAPYDSLGRVGRVTAAKVYRGRVSIDDVDVDQCLLVCATARRDGEELCLVVTPGGYLPGVWLDRPEPGEDARGRRVTFRLTLDVPRHLRNLRLSLGDRDRLVGPVLDRYLGAPDWRRLKAARLNRPRTDW